VKAKLKSGINKLIKKINNVNPLLVTWEELLYTDSMSNFQHQRAPDGQAWAALQPATLSARRKGRGGRGSAKILFDSGDGMDSVVTEKDTFRREVSIGISTLTDYMQYHHIRNSRGVTRKFIGWNKRLADKFVRTANTFVKEAVKAGRVA